MAVAKVDRVEPPRGRIDGLNGRQRSLRAPSGDPVAVKRKLGYLPESAPAYPEMTVQEFLGFIAEVRGFRTREAKKNHPVVALK